MTYYCSSCLFYIFCFFSLIEIISLDFLRQDKLSKFIISYLQLMINIKEKVQEATFIKDYQGLASQLPCQLRYLFVYPFPNPKKDKEIPKKQKVHPIILTYREDQITFQDLMNQLYNKKKFLLPVDWLRFTLSQGFRIPMRKPISYLQKKLGKDNLDGLQLYIQESKESLQEESKRTGDAIDECALMDFLSQTNCIIDAKLKIHFLLPNSSYVLSIDSNLRESITDLKARFFYELKRQFNLVLNVNDIKGFYADQKLIPEKGLIENIPLLKNNCQIKLQMKNPAFKFQIQAKEDDHIITLKGEFFNNRDKNIGFKTIKGKYCQLRCMQVSKIYQNYFLQNNERFNKQNPVCLKVLDLILKPQQRLSKLDGIIQKLMELGNVKIVGDFINQKVIFYKQIPNLSKEGVSIFSVEELEIPEQQFPNRLNFNEKMSERLQTLVTQDKFSYFKQKQRLQPIFIYTTNLLIKQEKDSKPAPLYSLLNKHLREQKFLNKTKEDLQCWYFRYASTLIGHLKIIQNQELWLFRGSSFDPLAKVGQFLTFKSFTSTTSKKDVALKFAINTALQNYMNKTKQDDLELDFEKLQLVMFVMNVKSAKKIDGLSYFQNEEEYLLEPFCQFIVEKVQRKKYQEMYTFTEYTLIEVDTKRQMPKYTNNYLIWIDNKQAQGRIIFNKFVKEFAHTTVLFQLSSTEQLKKWISQRQSIINDPGSKIMMITNMVRTQHGRPNYYAGIDSLNLLRELIPNIPSAFYVGNIQSAMNNLKQKEVNLDNVIVTTQIPQLANFIQKYMDIVFKNPQDVINQAHQSQIESNYKQQQKQEKHKSQIINQNKQSKSICNIM